MERVKRVRVVETLPEKRVRSAPRVLIPDGQVSVSLIVKAQVVRGAVSEEDLAKWVQEALVYYHRFRNGWVGLGATGGITLPEATVADDT